MVSTFYIPLSLPMWLLPDIADAIAHGLGTEAARLDEEHAVYGLDALDELSLHPHLAAALTGGGYGAHREQRYPADRFRRVESEGERCDFVLTPDRRPLAAPGAAPTLFDPPDAVELEDAFWMEVKVVSQFTTEGPNANYASQLSSGVRRDVTKLSKDHSILHAGLLIVLWSAGPEIAGHDLNLWHMRCLQRGLPIGVPSVRTLAMTDRLGNAAAAIALHPIHHF